MLVRQFFNYQALIGHGTMNHVEEGVLVLLRVLECVKSDQENKLGYIPR